MPQRRAHNGEEHSMRLHLVTPQLQGLRGEFCLLTMAATVAVLLMVCAVFQGLLVAAVHGLLVINGG